MDNAMTMKLHIHQQSQFYWLRKIRAVNIYQCCAKCFLGAKENVVYNATHGAKYPVYIELDIAPNPKWVAYYLCGLSAGFKYENNTHVAFVHAPGETLKRESDQMKVEISNARLIDFEHIGYVPNPQGEFTHEQRTCRNWIFANYLKDRMIKNVIRSEFDGEEL